uniref:Glycosyltransferase-like protein LARGE2 n=1 Tax=Phallusia mammillata TaxID=59560 RepID=A0A6F9DDP3_9ASCI|nr:glycosyltransferase-like protein LARGE2 [Phallusia mammillata]
MLFRKIIYKNGALKLLSLAIVLWLLYTLSKLPRSRISNQHEKSSSDQEKEQSSKISYETGTPLSEECTPIQVAMVCVGFSTNRQMVTLIKSILHYRKHHLHFHIFVNQQSKTVLGTMFRTWNVPNLIVTFYLIDEHIQAVSWIPNKHYAGVYGLIKLLIPDILPKHLKEIIVLDTDIVFSSDIFQLWQYFKLFTKEECIGLIENQSNWYLGTLHTTSTIWPALGRGFNTGIMLLSCDKLRSKGWNDIWLKVTKQHLKHLNEVALADQDIFNAVIKGMPSIVHTLPCVWNLQLSDNMKFDLCYLKNKHQIKAVHWNFRKNRVKKYKHVELFTSIRSHFVELNGALLRQSVSVCNDNTDNMVVLADYDENNMCSNFVASSTGPHRTHLFYFEFEYKPIEDDVSIVVHLSIDRLQMLEILCRQWDGPVSVAIFLSDFDARKVEVFVQESSILNSRKNIAFHLVFQNTVKDVYPINLLRNIALQQVVTDFVFLYDVDFVPMMGLYSYILSHVTEEMHSNLTAFVIPAFESLWYKNELPSTKAELLSHLESGAITTFRENVWPQGHAPTNYSLWKKSNTPYRIRWQKDFEPYVVLSKKRCPLYDKRFIGFGWNKISHIMELDAMGFSFVVLPHGFIIHIPHLPSIELQKYRTLPEYRECMNDLKLSFIEILMNKYHIDKERYKMFMEEY